MFTIPLLLLDRMCTQCLCSLTPSLTGLSVHMQSTAVSLESFHQPFILSEEIVSLRKITRA